MFIAAFLPDEVAGACKCHRTRDAFLVHLNIHQVAATTRSSFLVVVTLHLRFRFHVDLLLRSCPPGTCSSASLRLASWAKAANVQIDSKDFGVINSSRSCRLQLT